MRKNQMVTNYYLPEPEKEKLTLKSFATSFFPTIKRNIQTEIHQQIVNTENRIYKSVNKKIHPLDIPQMLINGFCKVMDKILDILTFKF